MHDKRVVLLGFDKMSEFVMHSVIRDLASVREIEVLSGIDELGTCRNSMVIDILFINIRIFGFEITKQMNAIREYCPITHTVCISHETVSLFICWKLAKNGIDVLLLNIQTKAEYERAALAIKNRGRFYPETLTVAIENREFISDGGLHILSKRERDTLVMTVRGYTLKEIAYEMGITKTTASTMRQKTYRKIGVNNLADLIKFGIRYNLHQLEGATL